MPKKQTHLKAQLKEKSAKIRFTASAVSAYTIEGKIRPNPLNPPNPRSYYIRGAKRSYTNRKNATAYKHSKGNILSLRYRFEIKKNE